MLKVNPLFVGTSFVILLVAAVVWLETKPEPTEDTFVAACGHQLREKLCFVDRYGVAECNLNESRFDVLESKLLAIFEHSPDQVRQKLCDIGAITVNYPSNGIEPWMGAFTNYEVIGINMFDWFNVGVPFERPAHAYLTWYPTESGSFSIPNREKIKVKFTSDSDFQVGLNYTLARSIYHEVGHLVQADLRHDPFKCISTPVRAKMLPFANASGEAYCDQYITPHQNHTLLSKLQKSAHVSYYASCTRYEDFAETYASYIMSNLMNRNIVATLNDETIYDQRTHLGNPTVRQKFKAVANIMKFDLDSTKDKNKLNRSLENCSGPFEQN